MRRAAETLERRAAYKGVREAVLLLCLLDQARRHADRPRRNRILITDHPHRPGCRSESRARCMARSAFLGRLRAEPLQPLADDLALTPSGMPKSPASVAWSIAPVALLRPPGLREVAEHLADEQRVALGLRVQVARQRT